MTSIERLFTEHHSTLVHYLVRRLGDRDWAEEVAQETFLRALRYLERAEGDAGASEPDDGRAPSAERRVPPSAPAAPAAPARRIGNERA
ncbi:MAG TPA: sigma factor, partial [Gemmatimonadaceae bacterium]